MKQEYAEKKTQMIQQNSVYQCMVCDKKFKTTEFVQKHIANKHADTLDAKFNKFRFEQMFKEAYMNDPRKLINQPGFQFGQPQGGGGFVREGGFRGGYQGRGGFRRGDDGREGGDQGGRPPHFNSNRRYVDYDDPQKYQSNLHNPERQIVSYDDLF